MNKGKSLVQNTLILALGKLSTQFVAFILLPIYTLSLNPDQYGLVDLILSYVALLAPLLMIQLDKASFRLLLDARRDAEKTKLIISNTLYVVIAALVVSSILFVILNTMFNFSFAWIILALLVSTVFSNLFLQLARGIGKNKKFAFASIVMASLNLVLAILLTLVFKMGILGVLVAALTSNVASVLYLLIALKLPVYISFSKNVYSRRIQNELIGFSWPLVPSALSWWFVRTFDRTLVTFFLGLAANGVYAAANKYAFVFNSLYSIFDLSWTESASQHINSKDRDKFFSSVFNTSYRFFGAIGLLMVAITPFIFDIIIGNKFEEAYLYIPLLIVGAIFNAAFSQYNAIYVAKKQTKSVLLASVIVAVASVSLNLLLIPRIGIFGACFSLMLSYLALAAWRHFSTKKYVTIVLKDKILIKLLTLFTVEITVYYLNHALLNVLNLLISLIASYALNKSLVQTLFVALKKRVQIR